MTHQTRIIMRRLYFGLAAIAFAALTASLFAAPASADEASAKELFKAMSDYLAGQKQLSFSYDTNLEIITADLQKVGFASSGTLGLSRPDKLRVTRTGGFADVELAYDGKKFAAVGKNLNVYTSIETMGSIDDLINMLRSEYGAEAPAADLLSANPFELLMSNVTSGADLGTGVIGDKVCDHLAFRTTDTDWQIWIAQGDKPYPCRFEITSKMTVHAPSYRIDITDWKTGNEVGEVKFELEPGDAKVVPATEFSGLDEVKDMLSEGMSQ